jgi:hypothetical protein
MVAIATKCLWQQHNRKSQSENDHARTCSSGSTASPSSLSSGSPLNPSTGTPFPGWCRNASGVSSTSTVRASRRPTAAMSLTHE